MKNAGAEQAESWLTALGIEMLLPEIAQGNDMSQKRIGVNKL